MKFFPWFRKKQEEVSVPQSKKPHKVLKRVFAGIVIGGAIGSIVGKRIIDKVRHEHDDDIEMEQ